MIFFMMLQNFCVKIWELTFFLLFFCINEKTVPKITFGIQLISWNAIFGDNINTDKTKVITHIFFLSVLPATAIQITSGEGGQGIHSLTMTNATAGGAIVQYAQGQEFFVPGKDLSVLIDYASHPNQTITTLPVKTELADDNSVIEYQEYPYDETSCSTSAPHSFSTLKLTEFPKSPDSPSDHHHTAFQGICLNFKEIETKKSCFYFYWISSLDLEAFPFESP